MMKFKSHRWYFRRIFANTSSPGMSSTSPRSIWETRCSASAAHKRSISAWVGRLRLVRSFSTKLIRASDGNESASLKNLISNNSHILPPYVNVEFITIPSTTCEPPAGDPYAGRCGGWGENPSATRLCGFNLL